MDTGNAVLKEEFCNKLHACSSNILLIGRDAWIFNISKFNMLELKVWLHCRNNFKRTDILTHICMLLLTTKVLIPK